MCPKEQLLLGLSLCQDQSYKMSKETFCPTTVFVEAQSKNVFSVFYILLRLILSSNNGIGQGVIGDQFWTDYD